MNSVDQKYVEKVLKSYEEKKTTKIDELRELDKKATKPAKVFAYVFGTIGSLILGFGMCVAMQVIFAELMWLGILVGVIGILMTLLLNIPVNIIVGNLTDVKTISILPLGGAVALIIISIVLTLIAGLIPSRVASKKDPVEALRSE